MSVQTTKISSHEMCQYYTTTKINPKNENFPNYSCCNPFPEIMVVGVKRSLGPMLGIHKAIGKLVCGQLASKFLEMPNT